MRLLVKQRLQLLHRQIAVTRTGYLDKVRVRTGCGEGSGFADWYHFISICFRNAKMCKSRGSVMLMKTGGGM
jgi:hypothetical protein